MYDLAPVDGRFFTEDQRKKVVKFFSKRVKRGNAGCFVTVMVCFYIFLFNQDSVFKYWIPALYSDKHLLVTCHYMVMSLFSAVTLLINERCLILQQDVESIWD